MKKNKTTRTLTLLCFAGLLAGFVAYKTGSFDKSLTSKYIPLQCSRPTGNLQGVANDTTPAKDTLAGKVLNLLRADPDTMAVSKSEIYIDQKSAYPAAVTMMSSSKSAVITDLKFENPSRYFKKNSQK